MRGTPLDDEEYRSTVLATVLQVRALKSGVWPFWTSELGLGQPHPLAQSFVWHPLLPLLAVLRVDVWLKLFYATHAMLGAAGMMCLARVLGVRPIAAAAAAVTMLLCATSQNVALTDLWPSVFLVWTMMPFVLISLIRLIRADSDRAARKWAAAAGLLCGLTVVNGHQGNVLLYVIPVLAFLAPHGIAIIRRPGAWSIAVAVMVAIATPTVIQLASELARFPAAIPRYNYDDPLRVAGLWDLFIRPVPLLIGGRNWAAMLLERGARVAFFGPPFAVLACAAILVPRLRRHVPLDIAAGFVVSLALLVTPYLSRLVVFPATSQFRDPMILFGTLLAAMVVDRLWRERRPWAIAAIVLQTVALAVAAWPFLMRPVPSDVRNKVVAFSSRGPLMEWLVQNVRGGSGRVFYSVGVDDLVIKGALVADGLWRNVPPYHGVRVVNGFFKGVSTDAVFPSQALPYGSIRSVAPLQMSAASLGALGIRHVLALLGESVAERLRRVAEFEGLDGRRFVLYEQPEVTGAFVVPRVAIASPPRLEECSYSTLVCADFANIWSARDTVANPQVTGEAGALRVEVAAGSYRTLVVAEMYRSGWAAAAAGRPLHVYPIAGGLVGVDLPAGGQMRVDLRYQPRARIAATIVAAGALLAAAILFATALGA